MAHRRIGQVLVDMGFITDEQQELLVDEQREHPGQLLGKVAIDMGLIQEEQLVQALAEQLSLQTTSVNEITINWNGPFAWVVSWLDEKGTQTGQ